MNLIKSGQLLEELITDSVFVSGKPNVQDRKNEYDEIKTALGDAMQNVAVGNMTALEAMEMVEEASQSVKR